MDNSHVQVYGDTAVLTYNESISETYDGAPSTYTGKVTMVYVKQGNMWRGVHYDESTNLARTSILNRRAKGGQSLKVKLPLQIRYPLLCITFILAFWISTSAQQPEKTPQPDPDRTIHVGGDQAKKFNEALKPHIEEAKRTYPDAKKRFLDGLPPKEHFYITVKLRDERGRLEQAFIEVQDIKDGNVKGIITDEITFVTKYKKGDEYTFPESELIDWRITHANGTEEGNFVGKFLDTYEP